MQLVVEISEDTFFDLKRKQNRTEVDNAVLKGIPLPKGHGALKDFEKIYANVKEIEEMARQRVIDTSTNSPCYMRYVAQLSERTAFKEMLYDAPTIIEADKENDNANNN